MSKGKKEYYLGLDIGTESVGYAVADEQYKILKFNGKSMWGSRLFDAAKPAAERREYRCTRRRLQRKKWRIELLQELFAEEIAKIDVGFFHRLKESHLHIDDKEASFKYNLFCDKAYTDIQFHQDYPTIYHLRKELITNNTEKDIRLVYLAIHHMMKHRGHFLFSGSMETAISFANTYENFKNCLQDELEIELQCDSIEELAKILTNKQYSKRDKNTKVLKLFNCSKGDKQLKAIVGLICGSKCKLAEVFEDESLLELEAPSISFSEGAYEEVRMKVEESLQDRCSILDTLKSVYDWAILADVLKGGEYGDHLYLSIAKVNSYEEHRKDLALLKRVIKEYSLEAYKEFFSSHKKGNYCTYIGYRVKNNKKIALKKCTYEDFYKEVGKVIESVKKVMGESEAIRLIEEKRANGTFMPLQVNKENGVIPYQVHYIELKRILENAATYFPFFSEKDESGLTVVEKILKLFEFRIPYYVGPLNTTHTVNSWMIRKEEGNIKPWNFEKIVDVDQSAEQFIRRMTNKCTYLKGKDVLPKNSMLYSEYMVWNDLNNVKLKGEKLSIELKQKLFEEVFKNRRHKRITGKKLFDFLRSEGIEVESVTELSGFDKDFKTSLKSYLELREIFGDQINNYSSQEMMEKLILWITLYGEETKMLKRVIRSQYNEAEITDEQLKKVIKLRYKEWGNFSKEFLVGLKGVNKETGEQLTIMQALRNTNDNLMQLLSQKYTFSEALEKENASIIQGLDEMTYESLVKDVMVSPAVKRAIWQVVLIAEEIKKVMKQEPKKIFLEVAREHQESKRTKSRKDKLIELYGQCKEEARDWKEELEAKTESDFRSIKLYLYYTQMGRCMYSGKQIALSELADTQVYDRDHIYPQSLTKDDSLDNLVLVQKNINATKSNGIISPDIQHQMGSFWRQLRKKGFISEEKYNRLMRNTPLTEEELAGFINRQLVETRQSTKVVAELFKQIYPMSEIVYVKAKAVADFRHNNLEMVKVRCMNDLHHAKDAYLNIVVGNVYHEKFTSNPLQWLKTTTNRNYSLNKLFNFDLVKGDRVVWKKGNQGTLEGIKKQMDKDDILYTRYAICNKGELFGQEVKGINENPSIPVKKGMDITKYGGYKGVAPAYFALIEAEKGGKKIRIIEAVPLYKVGEFEKKPEAFIQYCQANYGLMNPKVIIPKIKKDALLVINKFPMHLRGTNGESGKQLCLQNAVQLRLEESAAKYLKKIEKYIQRNTERVDKKSILRIREEEGITREENIVLYDSLLDKQKTTIYQYRPASQVNKLLKGREVFETLELEEQCQVLNEILKLMQCKPILSDLSLVKGASKAGNIAINKVISENKSAKLINQSVTGLFEQEIDLLTL